MTTTTTLFHTSAKKIDKVSPFGLLGSSLCFAINPYVMTAAACAITYKIELSDSEIIEASQLFYHENASALSDLVKEFCDRFDVEEDAAESLISEQSHIDTSDAEDMMNVQKFTSRAASLLGYRAVRCDDEQGSVYIVEMLNKENELEIA
jgi:hypothetical protein